MSSPASTQGTSSRRPDLPADERGIVPFLPDGAFELLYAGVKLDRVAFVERDGALDEHDRWCATFDKAPAGFPPSRATSAQERSARIETWNLPEPYASLDLRAALVERCRDAADRNRVEQELALFEARGLLPLIRAAHYAVDTARRNGVVVGVGRGSSVASHCLFLLGVHRIDSLRFGLDVREFVRD